MMKLPIRAWIRNAGAVFCGRHGAVSEQAEAEGCSRQTVYDHADKIEKRLAERDQEIADLRAENTRLKSDREELQKRLEESTVIDNEALQRFAITGQAIGISLRQTEELLAPLLKKRVPDHSTMGRWTQAAGQRAGEVLAELDPLCAKPVETLCIDEIFFGG
jgi:regulator of replication initiation timing